jgi:hypothetical protein
MDSEDAGSVARTENNNSLREIQNLLDDVDDERGQGSSSWRKYARLVLPHVGLVTVVCIYAMVGAWVFYSLESPNEDRLKASGIEKVQQMRQELVRMMWMRERGRAGKTLGPLRSMDSSPYTLRTFWF